MMRTSPQCQQDQNKADYMDFLYKIYQRDQAKPGLLGTFTGLYQQHCEAIGKEAVDNQIVNWHESAEVITGMLDAN